LVKPYNNTRHIIDEIFANVVGSEKITGVGEKEEHVNGCKGKSFAG